LSIHEKDIKMKKTILFLCVIVLFSCKKDSFGEAPFEMLGSWQWVSTSGGITGRTTKVDSTKQYILTISPNKKYNWCKNGNCSFGTWSIENRKSIFSDNLGAMIYFSGLDSPQNDSPFVNQSDVGFVPNINNDTLSLSSNCYDCVSFGFSKKK
jgi:hypothetical protein